MGRKKVAVQRMSVGFRATDTELQKLQCLAEKTGLSVTGVFRALIDAAYAEPVIAWRPVVRVNETGQAAEVGR